MKKFLAIAISAILMFALAVPALAIEENDDVSMVFHFKQAAGAEDVGLVAVVSTIVHKYIPGSDLMTPEYGWSQFDGPFTVKDGYVEFSFIAGYKETDVSEVKFLNADWTEQAIAKIPLNKVKNGKIEVWVTATANAAAPTISYTAPAAAGNNDNTGNGTTAPATGENSVLVIFALTALLAAATGVVVLGKKTVKE